MPHRTLALALTAFAALAMAVGCRSAPPQASAESSGDKAVAVAKSYVPFLKFMLDRDVSVVPA